MLESYEDLKAITHGKVVVVTASSHKTLSKPFLRIQENYEGRKFKGTFVSMNRFKQWYKARRKDTSFTYYDDWVGFNFPGKAVTEFLELYKGTENEAEKALLALLDLSKVGSQYIIGIMEGDSGTLIHEMAHALFSLDSGYKTEVTQYLNEIQYLDELTAIFSKTDYHNSVWLDEMQAYLVGGIGDLEVKGKPISDIQRFDVIVADVKKIFNLHVKKYPEIVALI